MNALHARTREMSLARLPRAACLLRGSHFRHGSALSSAAVPAPVAPAAALLVVGDEILAGTVLLLFESNSSDTKSTVPCTVCSRGVDLVRVEFVPDQADDIAATALRLRQRVGPSGFVFSSGGIGPTHDDVTYPALATAFGVQLALHQPTVELMKTSYAKRGMELNEARLRMATLPSPAEVLHSPGTWVPLVNLQGVYILPGIPSLFRQLITAHQDRFSGPAFLEAALYSVPGESFIADQLSAVAAAHPKVSIGSYPNTDPATDQLWKVRIGVSSRSQEALDEALRALQSAGSQSVASVAAAGIGSQGGWVAGAVLRASCKVVGTLRRTARPSSLYTLTSATPPVSEGSGALIAHGPQGLVVPRVALYPLKQGVQQLVGGELMPGCSSWAATQPAASEPRPSTPAKRTKAEQATEPTQPTRGRGKAQGKAANAKPTPHPGRWLDRDCNAALNMQRNGESRRRPLELCWWQDQAALPAKGKGYPGLGYKRAGHPGPNSSSSSLLRHSYGAHAAVIAAAMGKPLASDTAKAAGRWKLPLISPHDPRYLRWWYFTMAMALVTAALDPFKLSFVEEAGLYPYTDFWAITDYITTVIFLIDMVLKFMLMFQDAEGGLVRDHKIIALNYLRFLFWVDLVTTLPLDGFVSIALGYRYRSDSAAGLYVALVRWVKLGRLYRIFDLFAMLEHKMVISQVSLILLRNNIYIAFITHWMACLFYYVARAELFSERSWVGRNSWRFDDQGVGVRYVYSLYFSVSAFAGLGDGDFYCASPAESIVMIIFLLGNIVFQAYILGTVTFVLVKADEKSKVYRERMEALRGYAGINDLPQPLMEMMKEHIELQYHNEQCSDEMVLANYPATIRRKVLRHLYLSTVKSCYLFRGAKARFMDAFLAATRMELYMPQVSVLSEGDVVSELYIIIDGTVCGCAGMGGASLNAMRRNSVLGLESSSQVAAEQAKSIVANRRRSMVMAANLPGAETGLFNPQASINAQPSYPSSNSHPMLGSQALRDTTHVGAVTFTQTAPPSQTVDVAPWQGDGLRSLASQGSGLQGLGGHKDNSHGVVNTYTESMCFGEVPFFTEAPCLESVWTVSVTRVLVLSRAGYDSLVANFTHQARLLLTNLRNHAEREFLDELAMAASFVHLDPDVAEQLREMVTTGRLPGSNSIRHAAPPSVAPNSPRRPPADETTVFIDAIKKQLNKAQVARLEQLDQVRALVAGFLSKQESQKVFEFLQAAAASDMQALRSLMSQGVGPNATGAEAGSRSESLQAAQLVCSTEVLAHALHCLNQSLSSHLPGCGAGLALAALPLPLPLVGSAASGSALVRLLRLAGWGVLGPGSEAAGCVAAWPLRGAYYDDRTALMVASHKGLVAVATLLLDAAADPNRVDAFGNTALLEAVKGGHMEVMEVLLDAGAVLGLDDTAAASLLCKTVIDGDVAKLKQWLKAGVPVNVCDYDNRTPLHVAASEGNLYAVELLVETGGANVCVEDRWGHTPLGDAVAAGHSSVVDFLAPLYEAQAAAKANQAIKGSHDGWGRCPSEAGSVRSLRSLRRHRSMSKPGLPVGLSDSGYAAVSNSGRPMPAAANLLDPTHLAQGLAAWSGLRLSPSPGIRPGLSTQYEDVNQEGAEGELEGSSGRDSGAASSSQGQGCQGPGTLPTSTFVTTHSRDGVAERLTPPGQGLQSSQVHQPGPGPGGQVQHGPGPGPRPGQREARQGEGGQGLRELLDCFHLEEPLGGGADTSQPSPRTIMRLLTDTGSEARMKAPATDLLLNTPSDPELTATPLPAVPLPPSALQAAAVARGGPQGGEAQAIAAVGLGAGDGVAPAVRAVPKLDLSHLAKPDAYSMPTLHDKLAHWQASTEQGPGTGRDEGETGSKARGQAAFTLHSQPPGKASAPVGQGQSHERPSFNRTSGSRGGSSSSSKPSTPSLAAHTRLPGQPPSSRSSSLGQPAAAAGVARRLGSRPSSSKQLDPGHSQEQQQAHKPGLAAGQGQGQAQSGRPGSACWAQGPLPTTSLAPSWEHMEHGRVVAQAMQASAVSQGSRSASPTPLTGSSILTGEQLGRPLVPGSSPPLPAAAPLPPPPSHPGPPPVPVPVGVPSPNLLHGSGAPSAAASATVPGLASHAPAGQPAAPHPAAVAATAREGQPAIAQRRSSMLLLSTPSTMQGILEEEEYHHTDSPVESSSSDSQPLAMPRPSIFLPSRSASLVHRNVTAGAAVGADHPGQVGHQPAHQPQSGAPAPLELPNTPRSLQPTVRSDSSAARSAGLAPAPPFSLMTSGQPVPYPRPNTSTTAVPEATSDASDWPWNNPASHVLSPGQRQRQSLDVKSNVRPGQGLALPLPSSTQLSSRAPGGDEAQHAFSNPTHPTPVQAFSAHPHAAPVPKAVTAAGVALPGHEPRRRSLLKVATTGGSGGWSVAPDDMLIPEPLDPQQHTRRAEVAYGARVAVVEPTPDEVQLRELARAMADTPDIPDLPDSMADGEEEVERDGSRDALPWALPLPLVGWVGSAACSALVRLLRLAGGGVLGPGSEAASCCMGPVGACVVPLSGTTSCPTLAGHAVGSRLDAAGGGPPVLVRPTKLAAVQLLLVGLLAVQC
ncbi:hypothetical protein QJQ45_022546 [Haematococcus lacustris]|nr:hypothetical protein QJQ45_022546 [Haematococcus lacustris]